MVNLRNIDPTSSPLAAFGVQLRRSREARRLTQVELGKLIRYSASLISHVERAERTPPRRLATRADEALVTGGTLELMWWNLKHTALIDGFPEFASHEALAEEIRMFEVGVLPGLLQTEEYASALFESVVRRGHITPQQAAERLRVRLARQQLLDRSPAPRVHVILDESCLRRMVGGPIILARQLRDLERFYRRPNFVLQVAPFALGERVPFTKAVTLMTLPEGKLGYTETMDRGLLEREGATLAAWSRDYDLLRVDALSQADSMALIRATWKELLNMAPVDLPSASWLKSSYSDGGGGQCIEVARGYADVMPVRDSKDPEGPALVFPAASFSAFVAGVKAGRFGTA
ncbi:Scr1 family TA system antitoxin-like transcriptional regulator [Kitasatospora sp. NPDC052896]|uniref:helix-turn-helix domain-containing protein n=1 Tax=Kitasatospora sp. NPDC052896 TaxID=3364061 RepID=UPI0037C6A371